MATSVNPPAASAPPPGASNYERLTAASAGVAARLEAGNSAPAPAADPTPEPTPEPPATLSPEPSTPVGEPEQAPTPAVEAPAAAPADTPPAVVAKEPPAPVNPYDEEALPDIPDTSLNAIMALPQGKEIIQSYRQLTELAKPLEEGGIGHVPTTEQARNYYLAFRDQTLMNGDLNSGNPKQLERFFGHVFNPQRGEEANIGIASQLPAFLAEQPAIYTAVMEPFLTHYQQTLMDRFKETRGYKEGVPDEEADCLWFAVQALNNDLNGEYLPKEQSQRNAPVVTTVDPKLEAARSRFEQERAEFEKQKQSASQARSNAWVNTYNHKVGELLASELDQALDKLKVLYANAPATYHALRRQFHDEVVAQIGQNQIRMDLHNTNFGHALRAGTLQSAHAVAGAYRDMARDIIRANRKRFLEGAGATVLQTNQQRHLEAAAIGQHTGVPGGSGGVPGTVQNPPLVRAKDEMQADFMLRMVKNATANAARALAKR